MKDPFADLSARQPQDPLSSWNLLSSLSNPKKLTPQNCRKDQTLMGSASKWEAPSRDPGTQWQCDRDGCPLTALSVSP